MLRQGYMLFWFNNNRLFTLTTERPRAILPVFSTQESLAERSGTIPLPRDGVLCRIEVWMDEEGKLRHATAGGGLRDMTLDHSSLEVLWDSDPSFEREWTKGLAHLQKDIEKAGATRHAEMENKK
jgi:hypothetical protein